MTILACLEKKKKKKKKEKALMERERECNTAFSVCREDPVVWETSRETQSPPHTVLCTGVLQLTTEGYERAPPQHYNRVT